MTEPVLDIKTPEMRKATGEAKTLLMNLVVVGFVPVFLATQYELPEPLGAGSWLVAFFGVYCIAACYFCLRTLDGIIQSIHRRISYPWLVSTALLALLNGGVLGWAYRWLRLGDLHALNQTYGGYVVTTVLIVIALLTIWITSSLLIKLLINRRTVR